MQKPRSIIDLLSSRVLRLSNTLALYATRHYRDQFGVTLPEWRVMSIIASYEPTTARDISRVLATDKGWVGLSVERLRRRGFVLCSPDKKDARRTLLSLSERGRAKHDAILSAALQRQRRLMAALADGAADILIASLNRLQAEADKMLEEIGDDVPSATTKLLTRRSARSGKSSAAKHGAGAPRPGFCQTRR
jgi:DNA-binding MarR family transcriptional regulator